MKIAEEDQKKSSLIRPFISKVGSFNSIELLINLKNNSKQITVELNINTLEYNRLTIWYSNRMKKGKRGHNMIVVRIDKISRSSSNRFTNQRGAPRRSSCLRNHTHICSNPHFSFCSLIRFEFPVFP